MAQANDSRTWLPGTLQTYPLDASRVTALNSLLAPYVLILVLWAALNGQRCSQPSNQLQPPAPLALLAILPSQKGTLKKKDSGANEPRPLFSYTEDKLTYLEANRILQIPTDTQAQKEDVIHMVISPEKGHYEELGQTREERYDAFKEIIREAAEVIEKEVNFVELYWIAGIHLNTDIPHAHLAICRDGLNSLTKRRGRINHVPRTLLQHREKAESGEKELLPGKIADAVSSGIERQRQLVAQRVQKLASQDHAESRRETPPMKNLRENFRLTPITIINPRSRQDQPARTELVQEQR